MWDFVMSLQERAKEESKGRGEVWAGTGPVDLIITEFIDWLFVPCSVGSYLPLEDQR